MNRVFVTGVGAITPIGSGKEGLWDGLRRSESGVRAVDRFDVSRHNCRVYAPVDDFGADDRLSAKQMKRLDRFSQIGLVAGLMALEDAGLAPGDVPAERAGLCVGSALGGIGCAETEYGHYTHGGLRAVTPTLALSVFCGAAGCNLAIELGWHGYNTTNADSCASGPIALGNALNALRRGDVDVMIAGAADAPLFEMTFAAFAIIRAMSTRNDDPAGASRPFDASRDGFVMAEGAAFLVLETEAHARRRGAKVYAELAGFGLSNDAHHMAAPRPDGRQAARAMRSALCDAGTDGGEVDYVNAHGSSTPLNDSTETAAIRQVLGARADRIPVSGTKGMTGHSLGATGAIEAAACVLMMDRGWIAPTINHASPGEGCDLDYVPNVGRDHEAGLILSNSFGFGGINAALAFRRVAA